VHNKILLLGFICGHIDCTQTVLEKIISTFKKAILLRNEMTNAHKQVNTFVRTVSQSLMRQMANDWWMHQTARIIFRCNGAVNDSAALERNGILHRLQCMHYQLLEVTEEFIFV